jgi:mannose-6-phosphate isomerase-like protein (cupin superfamily)
MRRVHVEQLAGSAIGSVDDNFVIVEWTAEVGAHWIAPLHVHDEDDEAWYVLTGTLGFVLGDQEVEARAGSAVLARRGTAHTFWNAGPVEARYLLVMTPRIAQLIEEIHRPGADVAAIFAAHKSRIVQSP